MVPHKKDKAAKPNIVNYWVIKIPYTDASKQHNLVYISMPKSMAYKIPPNK